MAVDGVIRSLEPTGLVYFTDTYTFDIKSEVICVVEEDDRVAVVLRETVFYAQGGGQPSDVGTMEVEGGPTFAVEDVRSKGGVVYHYGKFGAGMAQFPERTEVRLQVDKERRLLHARLHSAGHLLDSCMAVAGYGPAKLQPTKGYHFPNAPYVEYTGKVDKEEHELLIGRLNGEAARMIAAGLLVTAEELSYDAAAAACGGALPDYIPKYCAPRIVTIGADLGCPCGGTHVSDVSEIRSMKVTGIRSKKNVTRISYVIE
mmetsp:Transcript_36696/g.61871  ORF Transcript_36696/g.61871 Transcript_36696/m.61871 type:complete len:259 (+) Transcript_36696:250-1026(+)|eukprot:CAMPEP_0198230786 /NCGR_PEP_ID=MMETSP1445-20131203/114855_1 /TAXON_ID=36898 /ORGANISM="Pyramimonas sp., Strain CCMP2087" /LENGTH=258 /DNA_ID=CAMNT_0043911359 /DNA_START=225 /DNA_END=1001 /DNA_ORIENTATION=+